jgi:hypothetical protein
MQTTFNTEARIDVNNVLVTSPTFRDDGLVKDFLRVCDHSRRPLLRTQKDSAQTGKWHPGFLYIL